MPTATVSPEAPWRGGLRAARANVRPGLALQMLALALVLAYYWHEPTHRIVEHLSALRVDLGLVSGIISTGFCGGVLPFLYLRYGPRGGARLGWRQGAFLTAFWAYKGLEVDLFYRLEAWIIGANHDVRTVVLKTLADQFVYCPLFAVPLTVIAYEWSEGGFSVGRVVADIRVPGYYGRRILPMLLSSLGVWVPAAAIIYSLPTPLQLPLQNVVLCFYTLLIAHLARHTRR
jgi:hypothetical protein